MANEVDAKRMLAHIDGLSAHNTPAKVTSSEPKEVKIAYESGLKMVHQKQGSEVCEMLGVDPRKGLNVSYAVQRLSKYGENTPSNIEQQLYGSASNVAKRYARTYTVLRGGDVTTVATKELVVGDVVFLQAGDHVPADIRILKAARETAEQYEFSAEKGYEKKVVEVNTVIDNTLPGGFGPSPVGSGQSTQMKLEQASNVALKGSTVLSGSLVGVVFGTGERCTLSATRPSLFIPPPAQRLPRGVDKKKVAKLAGKLSTLGMSVKQADRLVPLCGVKSMTVMLTATPANINRTNIAIKRVVALGFRLLVLLRPGVDARRDIAQLTTVAVGKPINLDHTRMLVSSGTIAECVSAMELESAVLAAGPDLVLADAVKAAADKFEEPVVVYSDEVNDKMALERATLGFCSFNACPAALAATDVVCEENGAERLALYVKILKESTEISS